MPPADLAAVGLCFSVIDLGISLAEEFTYKSLPAEERPRMLAAMLTPLCASAVVAGLLARYGAGKKPPRQNDVYRTFRIILKGFHRVAVDSYHTPSYEDGGISIIQKTVRSVSAAGVPLLTFLMQKYNETGNELPREVGWIVAGAIQTKFIRNLRLINRNSGIQALLPEVAKSLRDAFVPPNMWH